MAAHGRGRPAGHGDADEPPSGYGLASPAADVVAAMDALDVPSAVLVGSSSGGHVAQRVAVDAPRRVAGLVLAGAPRDLRGRPPLADEVAALTDPVDRAWARRFVAAFTDAEAVPGWVPRAAGGRCPPAPRSHPVGGVSGDDDRLLDLGQTAALVAALHGARWLRCPDTGHAVLREQPDRLAADVTGFLATVAPSGP